MNTIPIAITPSDFDWPGGANIKTRSGLYIDLLNPQQDHLLLKDIAHALSHICRFGGHLPRHYSVAEHSIYVANQLWRTTGDHQFALAGLLHDATEAYLGDMVRPLKQAMPEYRNAEAIMAEAIEQRFMLTIGLDHPCVKVVDNELLAWEMAIFRDTEGLPGQNPLHVCSEFHRVFQMHANDDQRKVAWQGIWSV